MGSQGVWECQPGWVHKTWWGSERLAGLRKDGSWRKLLRVGPAVTGKWKEGVQTGPAELADQAGVELWLAGLGVAQA